MADTTREPFEKPDVGTRTRKVDMAQAFATNFCLRHLYTTFVADHAAVLHAFVFPTEALPISYGSKNTSTEQAVSLWLERPVVDRFRFCHFPMRPLPDLFR